MVSDVIIWSFDVSSGAILSAGLKDLGDASPL